MTTWRDRTDQSGLAFFRGVPFGFHDVDDEIGRRTVRKEFPGRDNPNIEDLGRRARTFTLEMFVLGNNYDQLRDDLIEALEEPGPGELVHPYRGTLTVTVDGPVRVKQSTKEQGVARFTATFVETPPAIVIEVPDTTNALIAAAEKAQSTLEAAVAAAFTVAGTISAVADAAVTLINDVASTLNEVQGRIAAALQVIDDAKAAIQDVVDTATSIIQSPALMARKLSALYETVLGGITAVTDAFNELSDLFGSDGEAAVAIAGSVLTNATRVDVLAKAVTDLGTFGDDLPAVSEVTSAGQIAAENQRQIVRLAKAAAGIQAAVIATQLTFDSVDQAVRARDVVTDVLDVVIVDPLLPDELYLPLVDLRAAVVAHLSEAASTLPELDTYTPLTTLPALVVAYQIYGDAGREAELIARNPQVRDPSALVGGQPLQVLADG